MQSTRLASFHGSSFKRTGIQVSQCKRYCLRLSKSNCLFTVFCRENCRDNSVVQRELSMPNIVVLGSGIIGLSTAFYLAARNPSIAPHIVLLDSSPTLFSGASGRAAGFVAKDWYGRASASLGELSFKLHRDLAEEFDGEKRWGYSRSVGLSCVPGGRAEDADRGEDWLFEGGSRAAMSGGGGRCQPATPPWLKVGKDEELEVISSEDGAAQVDPHCLCQFLLETLLSRGVQVQHPVTLERITTSPSGLLQSLLISKPASDCTSIPSSKDGNRSEEVEIPCSHLLISAGPWSARVFQILFPTSNFKLPIASLAGHSIVLRSPLYKSSREAQSKLARSGCHAVFTTGSNFSPEIFSRLNGDIYLAGLNSSSIPLPDIATDVVENEDDIQLLKEAAADLISGGPVVSMAEQGVKVVKTGLCHRPVTPSGRPILARIPDEKLGEKRLGKRVTTNGGGEGGVFLASGHGPWGISLSLGTGYLMSEMMMGQDLSVDISLLGLERH